MSIVIIDDVTKRKVKNSSVAFVFITSVLLSWQYLHVSAGHFWLFSLIFVIGMPLIYFAFIGAGDIKLLMAYSLSIPHSYWGLWLQLIFMLGGVLAVVLFMIKKITSVDHGVPFAVPISVSSTFIIMSYIH